MLQSLPQPEGEHRSMVVTAVVPISALPRHACVHACRTWMWMSWMQTG